MYIYRHESGNKKYVLQQLKEEFSLNRTQNFVHLINFMFYGLTKTHFKISVFSKSIQYFLLPIYIDLIK